MVRSILMLLLALAAAGAALRPVAGEPAERLLPEPVPAQAEAAPQPVPEPPSPEGPAPALPPALEEALARRGLTAEELTGSQLVLTVADGSAAAVTCFQLADGAWTAVAGLTDIPGHVGRSGVSDDRRMGDGTTPAGLYALGPAFGKEECPDTEMPWRDITEQSYWTGGDTALPWFNRWVERDRVPAGADIDWRGSEHLIDHRSYGYCAVIQFNTGAGRAAERGFAIFFHCDIGSPTQGCVAIPEAQMRAALEWLRPDAGPLILIVDGAAP